MFPLWELILFSFFSACIQLIFPPYPSEILLLVSGGLTVANIISGPAVIISYASGTVFSSLVIFYFSRIIGKPILHNKYMRMIFSRRNQLKASFYMRRYGAPALVICKFLPGINTVCIFIGGTLGLKGIAPILSIVLAGISQNVVFYIAGMLIGDNLPSFFKYSKNISLAAIILASIVIIFFVIIKLKNRLFRKTV